MDVSPLYYVAVLLYIMTRLKTRDQIDELFETLKRVFIDALEEHPPPCNQAVMNPSNRVYPPFTLLLASFQAAYCLTHEYAYKQAVSRLKGA